MTSTLLQNKIALITGASRGIGAAVAKRFAEEGAHVILVARTIGGLEAVDDAIQQQGGKATLVPFDLTDRAKIDELAKVVAERFGKLDILVGNAAILGDLRPVGHYTNDIWDKVMATNVTANWALIRAFDPLLRLSEAGRAMFVTSGTTTHASPYWGPYAVSKSALETLVLTYAAENQRTNLRVNLIDPGVVRTKMRATAMPGEDPLTLPEPEAITDVFVDCARSSFTETGKRFKAYKKEFSSNYVVAHRT